MDNEDKEPEEYEVEVVTEEVVEAEPVEPEPVEAEVVETPPPFEEKKGFFSQFPRLYWVVDALEFFERGAFYGALAVLPPYVVRVLGFPDIVWGILYAVLYILLYFFPIIAAALAEKYGYRTVLISCLSLLMIGYLFILFVQPGSIAILVFAVLAIGFGAGAFKPLVSATIAHITPDKQRNFAYSIYYWFINLGAFLINLVMGIAFLLYGLAEQYFYYMFIVAVVLIAINIFISFSSYTNPLEPQKDISVPDALKKIIPALKDRKFMILCLIYSGFWFIYAFNHTFLAIYMLDFQRMPGWFNPQLLAIINPGTIIAVGPYLGKKVEKYKSLNVMMIGISISLVGFVLVLFSGDPGLFVTGILVFSIGEFVTHPGFIAYVSKIAPKDKIAIYMGILFIPTGIGTVVGGIVHGFWYDVFVVQWNMPKLFGAGLGAAGLLTLICLILYNRWINKMAKEEDPTYVEDKGIWVKSSTAFVALLLIPAVIGAGILGGTNTFHRTEDEGGGPRLTDWSKYEIMSGDQITLSGHLQENSETVETIPVDESNVISITFILTWEDEPDQQYGPRTYVNEPDSFTLQVQAPNGNESRDSAMNPQGGTGEIIITMEYEPDIDPYMNGTGTYNVTIQLGECGDFFSNGPIGFTDTENDWELAVDYEYYFKE
ncbi:MAG: MFS transporter [Thermoplasmata archaeon]|nr:MAG: MFS transporter [Thermoplasmata archaeon]